MPSRRPSEDQGHVAHGYRHFLGGRSYGQLDTEAYLEEHIWPDKVNTVMQYGAHMVI